MFKKIILKIIGNRFVAKPLLVISLNLHNFLYRLISILAIELNNGLHPKHRIIKYKEWFLDKISNDEIVLDIGCNTGSLVNIASEKAKFVYGIDINIGHIETAKSKIKKSNIKFFQADATSFDYSKCKSIDVILLSNVLEHIDDRVRFLKKILSQV